MYTLCVHVHVCAIWDTYICMCSSNITPATCVTHVYHSNCMWVICIVCTYICTFICLVISITSSLYADTVHLCHYIVGVTSYKTSTDTSEYIQQSSRIKRKRKRETTDFATNIKKCYSTLEEDVCSSVPVDDDLASLSKKSSTGRESQIGSLSGSFTEMLVVISCLPYNTSHCFPSHPYLVMYVWN